VTETGKRKTEKRGGYKVVEGALGAVAKSVVASGGHRVEALDKGVRQLRPYRHRTVKVRVVPHALCLALLPSLAGCGS
jgi:hypothetical protein